MMGRQTVDQSQLFYLFNLEEHIPADHLLRRLNPIVTRVLVDTSPDLREQLLDAEVDWLDAVLFTHEHADHTHGIDDLRGLFIGRRRRVDVYLDDFTSKALRARFGYCFEAPPGSVELFEADRIGGQGPSTHGPAPLAFLELLTMFHPCRQAVLGIQPKHNQTGDPISEPVAQAVKRVVAAFRLLAEQRSA